jgi:DNA (cytosine-5)-methyltransferase 1
MGASSVGANHQRKRIWIVAYTNNARIKRRQQQPQVSHKEKYMANTSQLFSNGGNDNAKVNVERKTQSKFGNDCGAKNVANTDSAQRQGNGIPSGIHTQNNPIGINGKDVAHTKCQRQQGQRKHEQSSHSTQGRDWQTVESEYGGSSNFWSTEPDLGRVANGIPNRVHRLKGLGNAQVPLQAAAAYRLLGGL